MPVLYFPPHLMYDAPVMKKTLHRYIFKEITVPFLLGMATFTSVLLMGRLLKLADLVVAKGVPLASILRMVFYLLPYFCLVTIPMAFLLAVLLAFGRLSADSEVTAMKACGVGLYGLLPPVFGFALIAYLATTFITVYALPWGNTSFKRLLVDVMKSRADLSIKERVFIDDFPGVVMYLDRYDRKERVMSGILIQDERNPAEPSTIFAKSGLLASDPDGRKIRLQLDNGGIHHPLGKTGYRLIEFQRYDLVINLDSTPGEVAKNELDMTFDELRDAIRTAKVHDKRVRDMLLELHRRFSFPFACFVFALVGMPLGIQNQRSGKASGFSVSIGIILAYYIVFLAGRTLGERGIVHPAVAVWTPNLIFITLGLYLFRKTASEQRMLIFELAPMAGEWVRKRLSSRRQRP